MIKINIIATKQGDSGKTLGIENKRCDKWISEIEFFGYLDEANCAIGDVLNNLNKNIEFARDTLEEIQNQLFDLGSLFYKNEKKENNEDEFIKNLDEKIQNWNQNLQELDSFLIPRGNSTVIALHKARTIVRKAERKFWKTLSEKKELEKLKSIGIYLNRLSDLIFIIIRYLDSIKWIPYEKRKLK